MSGMVLGAETVGDELQDGCLAGAEGSRDDREILDSALCGEADVVVTRSVVSSSSCTVTTAFCIPTQKVSQAPEG